MAAADKADGVPHPRETLSLYGHTEAELAFLDAYRGTRMPHAWLIGGPRGTGKATLAYRMARFVFAYPDPSAPTVHAAPSLALPPDNAAVRRVVARGHSDLLALSAASTPTPASCARRFRSMTYGVRSVSLARPRAKGAGASASWMRRMN